MFAFKYLVFIALISLSLCDEHEEERENLRVARDVSFSGIPKGGRVIIPNWNPNVKTDPWQVITGRKPRNVDSVQWPIGVEFASLSDEHEEKSENLRVARDVSFSGIPKGGRVVIPNWNPNVKTDPWQVITGRKPRSVESVQWPISVEYGVTDRLPRSVEFASLSDEHEEENEYLRVARDVSFSGIPKGGRVVIPNWNPNVKTDPWQVITGRKPRSVESVHWPISVEYGVTDRLPRSVEYGVTDRLPRSVEYGVTDRLPRSVEYGVTDWLPRSAEY